MREMIFFRFFGHCGGPSQLAPATSPAPRRRLRISPLRARRLKLVILAFESLGSLVLEFVLADEILEGGRVARLGDGVQS